MADLTHRNAATLIERAIYNAINRALRKRLPAAATITALRAVVTRGAPQAPPPAPAVYVGYQRSDGELIYCAAAGVCYEWSTASVAADNGDTVVKPTDAGATGRWLKTASAVQTGYLLDVRLYEGEQTEEELLERLLGKWPSAAIRWERAEHETKSQVPGALYRRRDLFDVWVASSNLRGSALPEAVVGSPVVADAADPGANAICGDVKAALAGRTGADLGQEGISTVEIGAEQPLYRSLAERRFVFSLAVEVRSAVHTPDTDLVALESIRAQLQLGDLHLQAAFDPLNSVAAGIAPTNAAGLVADLSAGSAYVAGLLVAYAGEVGHAFPASSWTYRDLTPAGALAFLSTAPWAPEPAVTAGALRVGVTYTDAAGLAGDAYLAATLANYGDPQVIPRP